MKNSQFLAREELMACYRIPFGLAAGGANLRDLHNGIEERNNDTSFKSNFLISTLLFR
jgi:hypothetical protein